MKKFNSCFAALTAALSIGGRRHIKQKETQMIRIKSVLAGLAMVAASAIHLPAAAQAPIKIAIAGPMTGSNATFGEQLWGGAKAYADQVNEKGGIRGRKIELVKGDDACEPKQAVALANRLVDKDKVDAVVGHFCSSSTIPASVIYADANILSITPASTNPMVTERKLKTVFRSCGRDDQQAVVAGSFLLDKLKVTKIALIHDKDTYGQGLVDALRAALAKRGVQPVLYEGLIRGERDFNSLVTKIKAANADAVYFGGLIPEAGPLIRQMREQGLTAKFVSGDALAQAEIVNAAGGPQFLKDVYYSSAPDPTKKLGNSEVTQALKRANVEPSNYALFAYASVQALVAAMEGTNVGGADAMADWLRKNSVNSAVGKLAWNDKGDVVDFQFDFFAFDSNGRRFEYR